MHTLACARIPTPNVLLFITNIKGEKAIYDQLNNLKETRVDMSV